MENSSGRTLPMSELAAPTTLPADDEQRRNEELAEHLAGEMAAAWSRGERLRVEDVLDRHKDRIGTGSAIAIRLINEEICLREEAGEEVASDEIRRRFPQWCDELDILLHCHDLIAPDRAAPALPEVGEQFGGFRLLAELGRGGIGRVFLASQSLLSGRLVVLKITPLDGREHLLLSSLQHTHIVPLYSVQEDRDRHVQAYCMPWLGGTTLARLLEHLRDRSPVDRQGADLLRALDECQSQPAAGAVAESPARRYLARASYVQAVGWIGMCVAEALHYVHGRGLVHLDVKPSNLLIAGDGQPMVLDFHLAAAPLAAGQAAPKSFGGTPGYLAPEHAAAMAAASKRQPLPSAVDGRSDIYALGVVLYEALAGKRPPGPSHRPDRIDRVNRRVSRGLADIVHKCLSADAAARYPDAAALADDLRRHLSDRPLHGVRNRSLTERWHKWRRRQPAALPVLALLALALMAATAAAAVAWSGLTQRIVTATEALETARQQRDAGHYALATRTLERGRAQLQWVPFSSSLRQQLADALHRTADQETLAVLRRLLDQLRFLPTTEHLTSQQLADLRAACAAAWARRARLAASAEDPAEKQAVRDDLREFGILWANLRSQVESDDAAQRAALTILDEAEALAGASPALWLERQAHAEALGEYNLARAAERQAADSVPRTAGDHFLRGLTLWHAGQIARADQHFRQAIELDPHRLPPYIYAAACAARLDRPGDAVQALSTAIALDPDRADFYLHRARAYAALGQTAQALKDDERALQLDPHLTAAADHRALLRRPQRRR